ncbi:MAG: hypothetical protein ABI405_07315 [Parafilimonas sp.]
MKTTLLLFILAVISFAANADTSIGQNRKLIVPTTLQETDITGGKSLAAITGGQGVLNLSPLIFLSPQCLLIKAKSAGRDIAIIEVSKRIICVTSI